jgi:hypothetical protein
MMSSSKEVTLALPAEKLNEVITEAGINSVSAWKLRRANKRLVKREARASAPVGHGAPAPKRAPVHQF